MKKKSVFVVSFLGVLLLSFFNIEIENRDNATFNFNLEAIKFSEKYANAENPDGVYTCWGNGDSCYFFDCYVKTMCVQPGECSPRSVENTSWERVCW